MDNIGGHSYTSDTLLTDRGLSRNVTVAVPPPWGTGYFTPHSGHLDYWTTTNNPSLISTDSSGSSHAPRLSGHSTSPVQAADRHDPTCLKLGKRHCSEFAAQVSADDAGGRPGRRGGTGAAVIRCLVDGCEAPLERAREYHRRHRVCELHTKAPVVVVLGSHQRFCQQCSKFHAVSEFDESKRSCRRRLAGHNERRRKTASSQGGALSLLSSRTDTSGNFGFSPPSDLSLQSGAALRELIAEHRATILAHQQLIQQSKDVQQSGTRSSSLAWRSDVETGSHVTLNLMQCPSSAFRLLSMRPKQQQQEDRCCQLWN